MSVTVVVLTDVEEFVFVAEEEMAEVPDGTCNLGVEVPLGGCEPGAC